MSFYQAMQLGAASLKPLIKEATDKKTKRKYILAFVLKNILCLLFCMIIAIVFSSIFGEENSIVGIITAMCILTFRFSNLDFNVNESSLVIIGLFGVFAICPYLASISTPTIGLLINFTSLITMVILSCHNIDLSNQSILIVSYFLLYGNKVTTLDGYINRIISLILGGCIVATIFYIKQRKIKFDKNLYDIISDISFKSSRTQWQFKLSIVISTAVFIGEILNIPKTMWIAFACMSVVQPVKEKVEFRYKTRMLYVAIGCFMYGIVYSIWPIEYISILSILGGFMVGMSASYQWQMVFNCFGALSAAVGVIGLWSGIIIRIVNNVLGSLYAKLFDHVFDRVSERISEREEFEDITANL